jgi:hypothetical protein
MVDAAKSRLGRRRGGSIFRVPETAIRTGPSPNSGAPYWPEFGDELPGRITLAVSRESKNRTASSASPVNDSGG